MLSIAAASGRVGYVFLIDGALRDWKMSRKAGKDPEEAGKCAGIWIKRLRPDAVVTEKLDDHTRKGERTRAVIAAIAAVASNGGLYDVSVRRPRDHRNKYEEAAALSGRFPSLRPWLPKGRKLWESEPRSVTYFEALALALVVIDRGGKKPPRS